MLNSKKILIGITGGIAAYKIPLLVRLLKKAGAHVQVICTPAALQFVTAETLSVLSENQVLVHFFDEKTGLWNHHVELGLWADAFLIAPCGSNTIAKMTNGECDNLLLTTYLSARCPVWIAPAMDLDMYQQPSVQQNLKTLEQRGVNIIPAETGQLASGLIGEGRMAEPEQLFKTLSDYFTPPKTNWFEKTVLITAGPTYENIDPVRFIGNRSSGKMGIELAKALNSLGSKVILVLGPSHETVPQEIDCIRVESAEQMLNACASAFHNCDVFIAAAAVADYKAEIISAQKIKKDDSDFSLKLVKNPDILGILSHQKQNHQKTVGFALETNNAVENALSKLNRKNLDAVILNQPTESTGFQKETNQVEIFGPNKQHFVSSTQSKSEIAVFIVNSLHSFIFD